MSAGSLKTGFFISIIFCYSSCSILWANPIQPPIEVGERQNYFFKGRDWSVLEIKKDTLTINEIIGLHKEGYFKQLETPVFNGGIAQNYYWFHFRLTNNKTEDFHVIIDLQNSRINKVECYEVYKLMPKKIGDSGDFYPFQQRKYNVKDFVFDAVVPKGESKDYYFHINQAGHTLFIPIVLYDKKVFESSVNSDYITDGITYGILFFVSLLCLLFYFSTKHLLYLFYALYMVSAIFWFLSYFGLGYQYIWGNYPNINTIAAPLFASLNIIFNLVICDYLLSVRIKSYRSHIVIRIICISLLIIGFLPVFLNLNNRSIIVNSSYLYLFLFALLIAMGVLAYVILSSIAQRSLVAKVYFLASFLKLGSIVNLALFEMGLTSGFYHMEGTLQTGIILETLLLCLALSKRYTIYKTGAIQSILTAQEAERALIAKDIHDSLSNDLSTMVMSLNSILSSKEIDQRLADKLVNTKKIVQKVHHDMRAISHNLIPSYLSKLTLYDAIANHIKEITDTIPSTNVQAPKVNFSFNEEISNLSETFKVHLFRIVQELLSNSLKHSSASVIEILFDVSRHRIKLIYEDNGKGFNLEKSTKAGMGIQNIKYRISTMGGNMNIEPTPHSLNRFFDNRFNGVSITIRIPRRNNTSKHYTYDY